MRYTNLFVNSLCFNTILIKYAKHTFHFYGGFRLPLACIFPLSSSRTLRAWPTSLATSVYPCVLSRICNKHIPILFAGIATTKSKLKNPQKVATQPPFCIILPKYLHISRKSSTFVAKMVVRVPPFSKHFCKFEVK